MRRKVAGPSNSTITQEIQSSGISKVSKLPSILQYPRLLEYKFGIEPSPGDSLKNVFCYIIKHYGNEGLAVLIYRQPKNKQIVVICGDWQGNSLDLTKDDYLCVIAKKFIDEKVTTFISTMHYMAIEQAQLFFAIIEDELILVDMQTTYNKLVGPGMIRDIFNNIHKTQEVVKIEVIDDRALQAIKDGSGNYTGNLIIKPSRFRLYNMPGTNDFMPLYVEIIR